MIADLSFGFFLQGFDSLLLQSMFPWMLPCPSMMLASHGNAPLTHQAAWFKPWKRLWNKICSRWNKRADWGFLVLIPHHCEIHGFERLSPAAAVHENCQQGIVYKSGANMHNTPEKDQNIMSSPIKIPPYKKGKVKQKNFGWEFSREDPFFVSRRNGGLLRDGMVIAMVTCYKGSTSGKTKEDRGYISTRGPWDFCWGSWTWTTLGRTLDSPLSGGKVVYDRLGPTHPEGDLMRPCHLLIAPQKSFSPKNWLNFWRKKNYIGDILHW